MEDILDIFISMFSVLMSNKIFEIPILVWLLIPILFSVSLHMIKSGKESDSVSK